MKGLCPDCEELVEIIRTGQPYGRPGCWTNSVWYKVAQHNLPSLPSAGIAVEERCPGSGKHV